jgi:Zn-dependent protease with chaperone function
MSPPAIMNYYDLFNQLGHHTNGMWVILSIRGAIATIGIVLNLILLWATLKSRQENQKLEMNIQEIIFKILILFPENFVQFAIG